MQAEKKMYKKAFEKVDADNGDNSIHVAVNFGASATREVSTGLVRCHPLRSSILGRCTGSSSDVQFNYGPWGRMHLKGTWISRAVNSPPREQHTSPLMKECLLRMAALWLIHSTPPLSRT